MVVRSKGWVTARQIGHRSYGMVCGFVSEFRTADMALLSALT